MVQELLSPSHSVSSYFSPLTSVVIAVGERVTRAVRQPQRVVRPR